MEERETPRRKKVRNNFGKAGEKERDNRPKWRWHERRKEKDAQIQ